MPSSPAARYDVGDYSICFAESISAGQEQLSINSAASFRALFYGCRMASGDQLSAAQLASGINVSKALHRDRPVSSFTTYSLALVQQTEVDMRSLAEFEVLLERSQLKDGDMVVVTLIGVLDARWPLVAAYSQDGSLQPYGFGHLNKSPAQLKRYTHIKNVEMRKSAR